MGGGNKGGGDQETTQKLDPWLKGQIEGNLSEINKLGDYGYQPFPGSNVAPLTGAMQQTLGQQGLLGQLGMAGTLQGLQGMEGIAGTQAQQVSAGQANLDPYMNPYQQQVVDRTVQSIDRQRQLAQQQTDDQAIAAGAFGGDRHGIAEAETDRNYADITANTVAQLNSQGFNTALGAAQNQQQLDLQAGLANQGAGLDAARLQFLANQGLVGTGQQLFGQQQAAADYLQNRSQAERDFAVSQWGAAQGFPLDIINARTGAVGNIPTTGSTTTSGGGGGTNKTGAALGGALSGAAMGSQIMPGWGTAIGAGVGLLGGMFG